MKDTLPHHYYGRSYSGTFSAVDLSYLGDALVVGDNGSLLYNGEDVDIWYLPDPEKLDRFVDDQPVDADGQLCGWLYDHRSGGPMY